MARRPRHDIAGAIHHVMNRGVDRQIVFFDDRDRIEFGHRLADIHQRFGVETLAYCLMPNHYHLLLHAPAGGLSTAMQRLGLVYTRRTNDRIGRDGPLFRGRYHAIHVTTDAYLTAAARYIHRNPLALRRVSSAADYRWSSYRSYLGLRQTPPFLRTELLSGQFGHDRSAFAAFTNAAEVDTDDVDAETVNSLVDLAMAACDLHRTGGEPDEEVRIPHRAVLLLVADAVADPMLRDRILSSIPFTSSESRRVALRRSRARAGEPMMRRVVATVLANLGGHRRAA